MNREDDVEEWYRQKLFNQEYEDIPQAEGFCEVEVPEEVEELARQRFEAARELGKDVSLYDYLNDHVSLHITFVVSGDISDDDPGIVNARTDE